MIHAEWLHDRGCCHGSFTPTTRLQIIFMWKCSRALTLRLLLIQEKAGLQTAVHVITYRFESLLHSSLFYLIRHRHSDLSPPLSLSLCSFVETSLWYTLDRGRLKPLHTSLPLPHPLTPLPHTLIANKLAALTAQG